MRRAWRDRFPLAPEIVMLNHASYGLAPRDMLVHCAALRSEVESDPNVNLGEALQHRLSTIATRVGRELSLSESAACALTTSATSGAAAVQRSLPLDPGDTVVVLDCEYSSVIRGWQRRCLEVGATLRIIPVALPLHDGADLLARMSQLVGESVTILQFSAITSSGALLLPVNDLAQWGHDRGATVIVDAAHAAFHLDVSGWRGVDAAFGTLHKWLPVPRSVGILWASAALAPQLRPAETSLTVDERSLAGRFGWPGTFDPASRLAIPAAIDLQDEWESVGAIAHCELLADYAVEVLTGIGAAPTGGIGVRAPRMRAFLLPRGNLTELRQRLLDNDIRAWTGQYDDSSCLVRLSTHVYNDAADIDLLAATVGAFIDGVT